MIKLKNVLKEQNLTDLENKLGFDSGANRNPETGNLTASSIGSLNETDKKIYQHILNAVAELNTMTADEVDDITEQPNKRQMYNRQINEIINAIKAFAREIEND